MATLIGCSSPGNEPPDAAAPTYTTCRTSAPAPPACGAGAEPWDDLLGLGASDPRRADLAAKAERYERLFHVLHAVGTGVNTEITVATEPGRAAVQAFADLAADDGASWDFAAATGQQVSDVVTAWAKVAGAYAGVGVAADAFRYATLRELGADCDAVDRAREHLARDLDALHLATAITGVPGVIARGFARTDVPGTGREVETTPLFDDDGNPLPPEKNNGTWREDNSVDGAYPDYVWEDSCSRDQYVGWVVGMAAAWEVIADDPAFDDDHKLRLQQDAAALAQSLMVVRERGYDLEIRDADGRATQHAILHEYGADVGYIPGVPNGFNALLALGIVAGLAYVAEDAEIFAYLEEQLIAERRLHEIARDHVIFLDLGVGSNFSSYNMAFAGGFLAQRYLCSDDARSAVAASISSTVYDNGGERQPAEQGQSLYDFVHALAAGGGTAYGPMSEPTDEAAIARGLASLEGFAAPPFWDEERINCDEQELAAGSCAAVDGTTVVTPLGEVGWNDKLVAEQPLPMSIRPPSNYYWRSNPYAINGGGDGTRLLPAVDFRFAYWMARWARR